MLLVGLLAAGPWWTTPDVFSDTGAVMTMDPRPVTRAALAVGVSAPSSDEGAEGTEVTFTDTATVELPTNSARAEVEVAVCRPKPGGGGIGMVSAGDVDESCDEVVPVAEGVEMTQGPVDASDYLIVTFTPTRPGKVRMVEVALDYRTGSNHFFRRGTDTIAVDVALSAR